MDKPVMRPISRGRFLTNSALAAGAAIAGGSALSAFDPSRVKAARDSATTTVTVMYAGTEFSPAYRKDFEQKNPDLKINFIEFSQTRLSAMLANGSPPDVIRAAGATEVPFYALLDDLMPLDSYFAKSKALPVSDMEPVNNLFRWNGTKQGVGARYGAPKDWSLDQQVWYNGSLFKQAGVAIPSADKPLGYDELLALGKKLAVRKGGKTVVYGLCVGFDVQWLYVQMANQMASQGASMFSPDLTQANFTSPEAIKVLQWYTDVAQAHVAVSALDPEPLGQFGLFQANRVAMVQSGYWWGGAVVGTKALNNSNVGLLPAPQFGSKRTSGCSGGVGAVIMKKAANPDGAWRVLEYFLGAGNQPAIDRAKSGWGLPAFKSLEGDLPQALPWQKQALATVRSDYKYFTPGVYSPYITITEAGNLFDKYLTPAYRGQTSVASAAASLEAAFNKKLKQTKAASS